VAGLDAAASAEPGRLHPDDVALLDALPYLRLNLSTAPEPLLYALFEATRLTIDLHKDSDDVAISIPLTSSNKPGRCL
jgi:site-specific DNA recombinase